MLKKIQAEMKMKLKNINNPIKKNSEEYFVGINQVENRIYRLEDKVEKLNNKTNMKNKIHERNFKNPNIQPGGGGAGL